MMTLNDLIAQLQLYREQTGTGHARVSLGEDGSSPLADITIVPEEGDTRRGPSEAPVALRLMQGHEPP